jgi:hypothetical protein
MLQLYGAPVSKMRFVLQLRKYSGNNSPGAAARAVPPELLAIKAGS